ncbi:DUF4198 domain-containing protein [Halodesulfovibrio spirochaetisodalis]|uniref:ATP-dependent DNA ligase n=1 Tax=Halodesulfovibrio spirochaetisodalis TaxID=1560234 RepID=A0A1B7XB78_9BACT|nr:DUF4198 domain-containing protein [Halodesulfovibrio spirochaetisodalis]OBQ46560.1 ATP-dependent DNA ligase [Halodesulfovibrio spirochaetisodalis]
MRTIILTFIAFMLVASPAFAHFGMVIPDNNVATQESRSTNLALSFSHPFDGIGMPLEKPKQFYALVNDEKIDLLPELTETTIMDAPAWKTNYRFKRPGVYQFIMEPKPYWEPEEDCFIVHYTKAYVAAFGSEDGWDTPARLPMEIVPLSRPYGLYVGSSFTGQVLKDGKPVPSTIVEYEFYNKDGYKRPTEYHVTMVVKTDKNGVFTVTCPKAGWWGFAALTTADYTMVVPDAGEKPVELGAVTWIKVDDFKK